jgi:hypothetical protein
MLHMPATIHEVLGDLRATALDTRYQVTGSSGRSSRAFGPTGNGRRGRETYGVVGRSREVGDEPRYVLYSLARIVTVRLETMRIVDELPVPTIPARSNDGGDDQ